MLEPDHYKSDGKNIAIAVVLSFLILLGYQFYFAPQTQQAGMADADKTQQAQNAPEGEVLEQLKPGVPAQPEA